MPAILHIGLEVSAMDKRSFQNETAFQVVCKDGKGKPLWDSGKREGDSMRVRYGGSPLKSRQCVLWQVRIWDEAGKAGPWSETATFEMGLLRREDWSARWITGVISSSYPQKSYRSIPGSLKEIRSSRADRRASTGW